MGIMSCRNLFCYILFFLSVVYGPCFFIYTVQLYEYIICAEYRLFGNTRARCMNGSTEEWQRLNADRY